jgi:hypothetical protein
MFWHLIGFSLGSSESTKEQFLLQASSELTLASGEFAR